MSLTELKAYTFTSRYARWNEEKKRRETWSEACDRVENMMMEKYADFPAVHSEIKWAYEQMRKKRVLGSQRALQFGGEPILKRNLKIFNCISSYCDRPRFFQECMYLLLCGCGAGFSVQKHHIDKLPDLVEEIKYTKKFVVEDSIEGWSDALGVLIGAYLKCDLFPDYNGRNVEFDFSQVRPAGATLSYGGKAPGPKPLKNALEKIESILKNAQASQKKLEPIQCYDIIMHAADSVIAGGVRRSATICMFSADDQDMMSAKTGNWFYENPQRGRSNNSVVLLRDECTQENFSSIIQSIKEFGEPGFVLTDNKESLYNPCLAYETQILTSKGLFQIGELENTWVEVWNGEEWSSVQIKKTAKNQQLLEIGYSWESEDGNYGGHETIYVTPYHTMLLSDGKRVEARELLTANKFTEMMSYIHPELGKITTNLSYCIESDRVEDVYCCNEPKLHQITLHGIITGQCVEINLYGYNEDGESGWQSCNLSTINCKSIKTEEEFYERCKAAAIIGTLQAGFSDPGYLTNVSQQIMEKEALIGVSMTGIMENPEICLDPKIQRAGAKIVKETNKKIAKLININPAARTTCVKPEGTASCVLGTSSGIHPHHARRYIRRVQANKFDEVYKYFNKINPKACTESVWSANDTDDVISFCIEVPDGAKIKNQMSAIDLLKSVKSTQKNWVTEGRDLDLCVHPWLNHNVSNTINVKPEEWDEVGKFIFKNREFFCGISLLPISGDKDFAQAPFTSVYLPSQMLKQYGDGIVFCSGLIEEGKKLWDDNLWTACDAIMGVIKCRGQEKKRWVSDCIKFATNYFDGDLKKLTYAMKDVDNFKLWTELQSSYQNVKYEDMFEETDNTKLEQTVACAGGSCELI